MKKLLTIALVAAATVATVSTTTACGGKLTDINPDKVTIWSPFNTAVGQNAAHLQLKETVDAYNAAHPNEAQVEITTIEGSYTGVASKMELNAKSNAGIPNIWLGYNDSAAMMNIYGALQDLNAIKQDGKTIINEANWNDSFVAEMKTVTGKLNGAPYQRSLETAYVDMALMKAVMKAVNASEHVDQTAPANWSLQARGADFAAWIGDKDTAGKVSDVTLTVNGTAKLTGDAQIKWADLETMDGMLKISNAFKNFNLQNPTQTGITTKAMAFDSMSNYGMAQTFNAAENSYSNYFLKDTGSGAKVTLDDGENAVKKAYSAFADIIKTGKGWIQTSSNEYSSNYFSNHNMLMANGSTAGAIHQVNDAAGRTKVNDIYVTTTPSVSATKKTIVVQGPSMFTTNVGTDAVQRSLAKFLNFSSDEAIQTKMAGGTGYLPVSKNSFNSSSTFMVGLNATLAEMNGTQVDGKQKTYAPALIQKVAMELFDKAEADNNTMMFIPPVNDKTNALRTTTIEGAYKTAYTTLNGGAGNWTQDQFWAAVKSKYKELVA